jgi:F0F1-type ATP synthase membrane subunit b/b'
MLKSTEKEYQDMLSKARLEANKIWENSKKDGEVKRVAMLEEAKNEVSRMIENGKKSLEAEKAKMMEDAKKEIVSLAMEATEKIINSKKDLNNL